MRPISLNSPIELLQIELFRIFKKIQLIITKKAQNDKRNWTTHHSTTHHISGTTSLILG
jgi:hypothetical protein